MSSQAGDRAVIALMVAALLCSPTSPVEATQESDLAAAARSGRYAEVIDALELPARRGETSAEATRLLVDTLIEVGRLDEAEEVALAWQVSSGDEGALAARLGRARTGRGAYEEARASYERSMALTADDQLEARLWLAELDFATGRRDAAMRGFDGFIDVYNRAGALSARELTMVGIACTYLGIENSDLLHDALRAFDEAIATEPGDPEPRVRLAQLFLDTYQSGEAAALIDQVAAMNPDHPRALLIHARRLHFDGDGEAMAVVDRALALDPSLIGAHVLRGQLLLQSEGFDAAAEQARAALQVNPRSVEALGVKAAAEFLRGDTDGFERTVATALEVNPRAGELFHFAAEMAVQNRLYAEAVRLARRGTEVDPTSWDSWGALGINQLRIGEIDAGRASLERAFAGDPFNVWFKNTLDLLDTYTEYQSIDTDHFELFIERDIAAALAVYMAPLAEEAWDRLTTKYGYTPPQRVRIEVYRRHADFSVRTVGLAGLGALGVAFGPLVAVDAPAAAGMGEFNWGSTLWHEITHVITLGATDNRIPRWLTEGLSVYEERRARTGWGEEATPSFLMAHLQDRLLPVSRINDGFVRPTYPEQILHSYFQASLVCELIERDHGFEAILQLLDGYRRGESTEELMRSVLGVDSQEFDATFVAYLEQRYAVSLGALETAAAAAQEPREGGPGGTVGAAAEDPVASADGDPGNYFAQLRAGLSLAEAGRGEQAIPYLERAIELFPEFAEAGGPYFPLAEAYAARGDSERAIGVLRAMLAGNESHAPAYERLAELLEASGRIDDAAATLQAVSWVDPFRLPQQVRTAELWERAGVWERAVPAREAVVALAPVDRAEALYRLAVAYRGAGDARQARRVVLRALEIAPGFAEAQELLLTLRAERREETR